MREIYDIPEIKKLFNDIIFVSESLEKNSDELEEADIEEIKNCLSLLSDLGVYVKKRLTFLNDETDNPNKVLDQIKCGIKDEECSTREGSKTENKEKC